MSMSPAPTIVPRRSSRRTPSRSINPVPKPTPKPLVYGRAAQKLAAAEGHLFEDVAADLEAADALAVSHEIDRRRDALVIEMTRALTAIRHDLNATTVIRALATQGEACGREAIRLDRLIAEHDARAAAEVYRSATAGQRGISGVEEVLTGREPELPEAMLLPFPLDGGGL